MSDLVCGIDVGTSAVRALVCDLRGRVAATAACALAPAVSSGSRREQDPQDWWRATCTALRQALQQTEPARIRTLAVDATSGTILLVDRDLQPVTRGILYNDGRAAGYGERINAVSADFIARHGYRFKDDFALAKILWLKEHDRAFGPAFKVLHQSDFVTARLAGAVLATDWSNALKSGCDLHHARWPAFLPEALDIPPDKLPAAIVAPGARIGEVCPQAAATTGLRPGTAIVAGASDGTAALFASGARRPGDFNTALGSTVTIKGISAAIVQDPGGVIYCHRHPSGAWLPGGAGNVGCTALNQAFAPDPARRAAILRQLDESVDHFVPSAISVYPLGDAREERFPFKKRDIASLVAGQAQSREELYAAYLQGIAFVERWCYEKLAALDVPVRQLFSTGGGSKSAAWCRMRADILGKPLCLPEQTESAFGAALLAAAPLHGSLEVASDAMVRIRQTIDPGHRDFNGPYARFRETIRRCWNV